jgi:hypothetical protein
MVFSASVRCRTDGAEGAAFNSAITTTHTRDTAMKSLLATLLATAAGATFAAAPTAALNHDPATYRNVSQKAATEYKAATAKCDAKSGNDKDVCVAEAKASRARTESDAIAKYNNSEKGRAARATRSPKPSTTWPRPSATP